MAQAQVMYGQKYAESLRALDAATQAKTNRCVSMLLRDSTAPGLNVERVNGAAETVLSACIDRGYRLIFATPEKGVFLLLFAGQHDEAYRSARTCHIPAIPASREPAVSHFSAKVPEQLIPFGFAAEVFEKMSTARTRKYLPLYVFLCEVSANQRETRVTFGEIEKSIGAKLPSSARGYPAWWGNDHSQHVQASAWLAAGWHTRGVDLSRESVVFVRDM
jgi:hypothetical protein